MTGAWLLLPLALCASAEGKPDAAAAFQAGVAARASESRSRPLFRQAAESYADMRRGGRDSAELHRNEGHARILAGDIPGAITAYHRGLRLEPDHADIQRGLAYARSQVDFATPEERQRLTPQSGSLDGIRSVLRRFGIVILALLSIAGWMALSAWLVARRGRWMILALVVLALGAAWTGAIVWESTSRAPRYPVAVVTQPAFLRRGDGLSFPLRRESPLPAGTEVTILFRRGAWRQIELTDGTIGWMPAGVVVEP